MLLGTGLGSNSLTGSPKQAPMGTRPTLTVAVPGFLVHAMDWMGPPQFLTVIGLAAGQLGILLGKGGECVSSGISSILASDSLDHVADGLDVLS
jgi:hypothetical protein